jgi:hypothetical protein
MYVYSYYPSKRYQRRDCQVDTKMLVEIYISEQRSKIFSSMNVNFFFNVKWRTAYYLMRRHLQSCQAGGEGDEDEDVAVPHGGPTHTDGPLPPMGEQAEPER